ncbi:MULTISPECIES: carbohydrate ABC transporter permease [unclassified Leifsonia]|uniref:carbohydrate ABC transporter permease n=1 Tax=unclassified Leifsonia TaxID=2663824 RepID=UPI000A18CEC1|nr:MULTISPECIES: carbohydrate ABC transporter permease [unclassified Leifsonia]QIZ97319.1 carbohydrate ABC transporter permease [Leifsonia sp. PS1209]
MSRERTRAWIVGIIAIVVSVVVFLVPFVFVLLQAAKSPAEASNLAFSWPKEFLFFQNFWETLNSNDGVIWRAIINSAILTIGAVAIMVVLSAMAGYVLARKKSKWGPVVNFFVLAGLIVPPAVVPTIWVLQGLQLFGTMPGMILVEATFGLSFCILLFRAFVGNIPRELDEAAVLDGSGPIRLFFRVVLPLLRPVVVTVIVVQSVFVFNDFAGPLYFLPGDQNVTVQLALYTFSGQNLSFYNLLFMAIFLITIPPLIAYIFFNRQIVAGITSGAVKG